MDNYVLIITLHADPAHPPGYNEWGGTHTYMNELLLDFTKRRVRCVMVTRKTFHELPDVEEYSEYCIVIRLSFGAEELMNKKRIADYHNTNMEHLRKIISKHGVPSVIHSVYWNSGRLAMDLSQEYNVSFVHSVISNSRGRVMRGAEESSDERDILEYQIYHAAKYILTVSDHEKQDIVSLYNVSAHKILVAGQYIHPAYFEQVHDDNGFPRLRSKLTEQQLKDISRRYLPEQTANDGIWWQRKAFIYMGRMHINKGVLQVVKAWYALYERMEGACPALWLAGGSPDEIHSLRKTIGDFCPIDELEFQNNIVWWGILDAHGLSTLLLKSSVLITHSLYEPGGRVIVEAFCQGVPVIATPNGFAADYVEDMKNGFLVAFNDITALTNRMELFIRQPLLSHSMGRYARESGQRIIIDWNYFDTHLYSYEQCCGYHLTESAASLVTAQYMRGKTDGKKRLVDAYPYPNNPLSTSDAVAFARKILGEACSISALMFNDSSSDFWSVTQNCKQYMVKRPNTKYSFLPFYHPYFKTHYADTAKARALTAISGLQALDAGQLLGYDEQSGLLLLSAYTGETPSDVKALDVIAGCLELVVGWTSALNSSFDEKIRRLPYDSLKQEEGILRFIEEYTSSFPGFSSGCTGIASLRLAFAMWPTVLAYNHHFFEQALYTSLNESVERFAQIAPLEVNACTGYIHGNMLYRHIILSDKGPRTVDIENAAYGFIGYDIANLLYDIARNNGELSTTSYWDKLIDNVPEVIIGRDLLIAWIAHLIISEITLFSVLGKETLKLQSVLGYLPTRLSQRPNHIPM